MSGFKYRNKNIKLPSINVYANGVISEYSDGRAEFLRDFIDYEASEEDRYHTVKMGDTVTSIAYKFYKDQVKNTRDYTWFISEANKIENPLYLDDLIGTEIVIPDINNFKIRYL